MLNAIRQQKGFTIIELLVVIVIIGILVALLLPNLFSAQQRARDTERKNDLKTVQQQLETYFSDNNSYPGDEADLVTAGYMDEVPEDPQSPTRDYDYEAVDNAGGPCTTAANDCVSYTLTAELENENDPDADATGNYVIESINQ